jgi:hypothetical protein
MNIVHASLEMTALWFLKLLINSSSKFHSFKHYNQTRRHFERSHQVVEFFIFLRRREKSQEQKTVADSKVFNRIKPSFNFRDFSFRISMVPVINIVQAPLEMTAPRLLKLLMNRSSKFHYFKHHNQTRRHFERSHKTLECFTLLRRREKSPKQKADVESSMRQFLPLLVCKIKEPSRGYTFPAALVSQIKNMPGLRLPPTV